MLMKKQRIQRWNTIFRHLLLSFFPKTYIKYSIKIRRYKIYQPESISEIGKFEPRVPKRLKRERKLKLIKFLTF